MWSWSSAGSCNITESHLFVVNLTNRTFFRCTSLSFCWPLVKVSSIITCGQLPVYSSNDSFPHFSCKCDHLAVLFLLQECPPFSPAHCYLSIAKDEKGEKWRKSKSSLQQQQWHRRVLTTLWMSWLGLNSEFFIYIYLGLISGEQSSTIIHNINTLDHF